MTRSECLDAARECVLKNRQDIYGPPEDGFALIAVFWSAYTGHKLESYDVAAMMVLLKVARFSANPQHEDSMCDAAGYSACAIELATGVPTPSPAILDNSAPETITAQAQAVHRPRHTSPLWER